MQNFLVDFDANLNRLSDDIRAGNLPYGRFRTFTIHDPKKRLIHAACFEDRIFHHALMNFAGPILERTMSPCSFACRPGMGVHKAVRRVRQNLCRYQYFGKIDIDGYFASINHHLLLQLLLRRFKGQECMRLFERILTTGGNEPGKGLPIGSLTSQYSVSVKIVVTLTTTIFKTQTTKNFLFRGSK